MHETNCESTGWIHISKHNYKFKKNGLTKIQIELNQPRKGDNYGQYLSPHNNQRGEAPIRQCSMDLEVNSGTPGKFPNANLPTDCIFQASNYIQDFGTDNTWTVLLYLGAIDPLLLDDPTICAIECKTEEELLHRLCRLWYDSEVDFVHAWNGFDFDFPYIIKRAKMLGIWESVYQEKLTRIKSIPAIEYVKELKSGAYGSNTWTLLQMPGRITFDPMVHIKREFRRNENSLNAVAEDYLSYALPKNPLTCEKGSDLVKVKHKGHPFKKGDVVHLMNVKLPETCKDEDGKTYYGLGGYSYDDWLENLHDIVEVVHDIVEVDKEGNEYTIRMPSKALETVNGGGGENVLAFESKHDVTAQQMFDAFQNGDKAMLRKVGLYCIQDTILPQRIINKLSVLPFLLAVSRVCWVPIPYLITHGQQIKFHSQISKAAAEKDYMVHMVMRQKNN
jgi:DNA polymerase elongation subunit (family B)